MNTKVKWQGTTVSVQPRIRLMRSFDQRSHSYVGYVLRLRGTIDGEEGEFTVAVGKGAHEKHQFRAGHQIAAESLLIADPGLETAEFYKISAIRVLSRTTEASGNPPPFLGIPPPRRVPGTRSSAACCSDLCRQMWSLHLGL